MAYCCVKTEGVKSVQALDAAYAHNTRAIITENVNPELSYLNREIIPNVPEGRTYSDAYDELTKKYGTKPYHPTKDNRGIEVVCQFSREAVEEIDVDLWISQNVKFLQAHFTEENVVSAILHLDEASPHIHGMVIPLDPKHRLNAGYWIDGKYKLSKMQTIYAEFMSPCGLKRGLMNRRASYGEIEKYNTVEQYYKQVHHRANEALPQPLKGESLSSYIERNNEWLRLLLLSDYKDIKKLERKLKEGDAFIREHYGAITCSQELLERFDKRQVSGMMDFLREHPDKILDMMNPVAPITKTTSHTK